MAFCTPPLLNKNKKDCYRAASPYISLTDLFLPKFSSIKSMNRKSTFMSGKSILLAYLMISSFCYLESQYLYLASQSCFYFVPFLSSSTFIILYSLVTPFSLGLPLVCSLTHTFLLFHHFYFCSVYNVL